MLLHADRKHTSAVSDLADGLWYPIWDTGVHLDHSVRTFDEARRLASTDLQSCSACSTPVTWPATRPSRSGCARACSATGGPPPVGGCPSCARRGRSAAAVSGDLRYDLEPDLKEGRGGLRDLVSLRAVAASWVADRPHRDVDDAVRRLPTYGTRSSR